MAKLLHTSASIAVSLISLSLMVVLAMSVLPLASGGMALEENTPFGVVMDGTSGMVIIQGSYDIVSSLPYDITDISANASIDDGSGEGLEIFKIGPLVVAGNGSSTLDIHSEVFIPSVLIAALAANVGSEEEGLRLPITIEAGGSYLERLITLKATVSVSIVLSDVEIPPFNTDFRDEHGNVTSSPEDVAKITVGVGDIPGGDFIDDLPDSAVISVPIGSGGEDVFISITKTGPDINGNYSISVVIESSDGTLLDALNQLIEDGEAVEIDMNGDDVTLDPESVALLAESLKATLEALLP